jgi:nucleotide-binding universal stress UspA family protein
MRILIATDGSPSAQRACVLAGSIDWPAGSTIRIVTVLPYLSDLGGTVMPAGTPTRDEDAEASMLRDVARHATLVARDLAKSELVVDTVILRGSAAHEIVAEVERFDPDLVMVGSRGHGPIESMVLGSVADQVVDRVHRPVLVARGSKVRRVVLGTDGSPAARAAVGIVSTWPLFAGTSVQVVSVAANRLPWWSGMGDSDAHTAQSAFDTALEAGREIAVSVSQEAADVLRESGHSVQRVVCSGDPAYELLVEARAYEADLIVVGSRGNTGLKRLWLGSVARNVVHHADCSVLVVPMSAATSGRVQPDRELVGAEA